MLTNPSTPELIKATFKDTRGTIAPCVFFSDEPQHESTIVGGGVYYLFKSPELIAKFSNAKKWLGS